MRRRPIQAMLQPVKPVYTLGGFRIETQEKTTGEAWGLMIVERCFLMVAPMNCIKYLLITMSLELESGLEGLHLLAYYDALPSRIGGLSFFRVRFWSMITDK